MSLDTFTGRQKALGLGAFGALLAGVVATGLLLRAYGPGNMGNGLLVGAAVGLLASGVGLWRVTRHRERATTFERAWTQTGDERDDAVLTRALAVLGLGAFPLTAAAAILVAFGADVAMMLALLLLAQVAVFAVAYALIHRSS